MTVIKKGWVSKPRDVWEEAAFGREPGRGDVVANAGGRPKPKQRGGQEGPGGSKNGIQKGERGKAPKESPRKNS